MQSEFAFLTPEKTILESQFAALGSRILAQLIDGIVVYAGVLAIILVASQFVFSGNIGADMLLPPLLIFSPFLYFILMEGLCRGRSVGKMVTGIHVVMVDGTPITFQAAIGRNIMRVADFLPMFYFLGACGIFLTPKSQRLGDQTAGTIVIRSRPAEGVRIRPAPHRAGVHAFESAIGSLRGMTIEEYGVLKCLCDRFPELSYEAGQELLTTVWEPIAAKYGIKPVPGAYPLQLAEATVMKFSREHGLL